MLLLVLRTNGTTVLTSHSGPCSSAAISDRPYRYREAYPAREQVGALVYFSNSDMDLLREEVGVGVAVEQGQYSARGRRSVLIEKKLEKESLPSHEDRNRGIGYTGLLNGLVSYTGISPVLDRQ